MLPESQCKTLAKTEHDHIGGGGGRTAAGISTSASTSVGVLFEGEPGGRVIFVPGT